MLYRLVAARPLCLSRAIVLRFARATVEAHPRVPGDLWQPHAAAGWRAAPRPRPPTRAGRTAQASRRSRVGGPAPPGRAVRRAFGPRVRDPDASFRPPIPQHGALL